MRRVLPSDWLTTDHLVSGESTLHQVTGYEFTDTLFSSIENFSASQPSLARLYSAATSPSERLRSDGSLAIIISEHYFSILYTAYTVSLSPRLGDLSASET